MGSREHPLLMRGPLVVASLAGTKTQTRRLVAAANSTVDGYRTAASVWPYLHFDAGVGRDGHIRVPVEGEPPGGLHSGVATVRPRLRPGDAIWIREAWQTGSALDDEAPSMLAAWAVTAGREPCGPVRYMADDTARDAHLLGPGSYYGEHWGRTRPGIYLPRWASRLVLHVVSVRAERVRLCSEDDAMAEGVGSDHDDLRALSHQRGAAAVRAVPSRLETARDRFRALWNSINDQRPGASWAANPWVWAITYRRVEP